MHTPLVEFFDAHTLRPRPVSGSPNPGDLLVATPSISDADWRRAVVLMLTSDSEGSIGVILNRRASVSQGDLPEWARLADDILIGGPVTPEGLIGLCPASPERGQSGLVPGISLMDLDQIEASYSSDATAIPARWRLFAGYAGWGSQQLIDEIERGDWIVVTGDVSDVLEVDPDLVWSRVLSRQENPLVLWATLSDVPEMN